MRYTVRLKDDTVGEINTDKDMNDYIGKNVNILLHDENGNEIIKGGDLEEILEENEI
jgi:hypothetical protein